MFKSLLILIAVLTFAPSVLSAQSKKPRKEPLLQDQFYNSVANGDVDNAQKYLAAGAKVAGLNSLGHTPLVGAFACKGIAMIEFLLKHGADPNQASQRGYTPLMSAAGPGKLDQLFVLLSAGANVNLVTECGTALLWAACSPDTASVTVLIKLGAQLELRDSEGRTALMVASTSGRNENLKALIDAGANVNATDKAGRNALMRMMAGDYWLYCDRSPASQPEIARLLIANGLDVRAKDKRGKTALKYATEKHKLVGMSPNNGKRFVPKAYEEIAQMLRQAGAVE